LCCQQQSAGGPGPAEGKGAARLSGSKTRSGSRLSLLFACSSIRVPRRSLTLPPVATAWPASTASRTAWRRVDHQRPCIAGVRYRNCLSNGSTTAFLVDAAVERPLVLRRGLVMRGTSPRGAAVLLRSRVTQADRYSHLTPGGSAEPLHSEPPVKIRTRGFCGARAASCRSTARQGSRCRRRGVAGNDEKADL
jgi:hypothetical protein